MPEDTLLAVASSVAADHDFDNHEGLDYAIAHGFTGYQPYITPAFATYGAGLTQLETRARAHGITLLAHLPGVLSRDVVENPLLNNAVCKLFSKGARAQVVHHHDAAGAANVALSCLDYAHRLRFTVCLENYFDIRSPVAPAEAFARYLSLLTTAKAQKLNVIPVLDIPRLYDERLNLTDVEIDRLWEQAVTVIGETGLPLILHLIDGESIAGRQWTPLGQGKIPYARLFADLKAAHIPIQMIVLEYEDRVNPIESLAYLREQGFTGG